MSALVNNTVKEFSVSSSKKGRYYSLSALADSLGTDISRLPVSIRIVLESVLRNCDGVKVTEDHVRQLAAWKPNAERVNEIPFVVSRVILQDFTGIPLLADLAAMRSAAQRLNKDPKKIEPLVPVDLVVDHSVQIDNFRRDDALDLNMKLEFQRNKERYQFMKWGMQAFETFGVVPPGFGIVHQVNMEHLARGVHEKDGVYYPDTLVGTDSHTTMINGVGVVGWGVGGIEAEAGMLGQPVYFLTPDVIGMHLKGSLPEGTTATDLVLTITERLRRENVVGKFVEFFGEGAASLSATDRATISNMAPEYGATVGFFTVDDATCSYLSRTGRTDEEISALKNYFKAQGLYGIPKAGDIDYTRVVELDLSTVVSSLAGPRRPQDRIALNDMKGRFTQLLTAKTAEGGFNKQPSDAYKPAPVSGSGDIKDGDIVIAAITSCTNTSNPAVLLAAGLLAKKAVAKGLSVSPRVKTSLAPGSRIVTEYLTKTNLLAPLEKLGFFVSAYGCATCIGNAGDLTPELNESITKNNIVAAAVLSGNRNFEARIHPNIRANFLASPPLVVAYAIAGNVSVDLTKEPLGKDASGNDVFLKDIWPTSDEINAVMDSAFDTDAFVKNYAQIKTAPGALWEQISGFATGDVYDWPQSTYIAEPPFFEGFGMTPPAKEANISGARALAVFGDSITTDHISPAGSIGENSPAGQWLKSNGVGKSDFNSFGSRRGNHSVMMRGTFANVRIKNLMLPAAADGSRKEGGFTRLQPNQTEMPIYDAAMSYVKDNVPTVVFGGTEYGTGSSRDWAAKGTQLLGVKAVIARSFERIHRSNLIGMAVLPFEFMNGESAESLGITGTETYDITGLDTVEPGKICTLVIRNADGSTKTTQLRLRIDTAIEVEYFKHGGILPFVLRQLLA